MIKMSIIGEIRKKNNLKMRYLKYFFLIFIIVWLTLTDFSFNRILISEILASFLYSVFIVSIFLTDNYTSKIVEEKRKSMAFLIKASFFVILIAYLFFFQGLISFFFKDVNLSNSYLFCFLIIIFVKNIESHLFPMRNKS